MASPFNCSSVRLFKFSATELVEVCLFKCSNIRLFKCSFVYCSNSLPLSLSKCACSNVRMLSPLRKPKNIEAPLRHYNSKVHKTLLFSVINLVQLRDFVPLWRKKTCRSGLAFQILNHSSHRSAIFVSIRLAHKSYLFTYVFNCDGILSKLSAFMGTTEGWPLRAMIDCPFSFWSKNPANAMAAALFGALRNMVKL